MHRYELMLFIEQAEITAAFFEIGINRRIVDFTCSIPYSSTMYVSVCIINWSCVAFLIDVCNILLTDY